MEKEDILGLILFGFGLPLAIFFLIALPALGSSVSGFLDWWISLPPLSALAVFCGLWLLFVFMVFVIAQSS